MEYHLCCRCVTIYTFFYFRGNCGEKCKKKNASLKYIENEDGESITPKNNSRTLVKKKSTVVKKCKTALAPNVCQLSEYEKINRRSIEENRAKMIELGLINPVVVKKRNKKHRKVIVCTELRKSERLSTKFLKANANVI